MQRLAEMLFTTRIFLIALIIVIFSISSSYAQTATLAAPNLSPNLNKVKTIKFEEQINKKRFLLRNDQYFASIQPTKVELTLRNKEARATSLVLNFIKANSQAEIAGINENRAHSNYLLGSDSSQWHNDVKSYQDLKVSDIYPGVDLHYYQQADNLEFDIIVAPGSNSEMVKMVYSDLKAITIDQTGDLLLTKGTEVVRQHRPIAYQIIEGERHEVSVAYNIAKDRAIGFTIGDYDHQQPLIIDPVITYSTFLGGDGLDTLTLAGVDGAGNYYLTGTTTSTNFPVVSGSSVTPHGLTDIVVVKISSQGQLVYSTFIGGQKDEAVRRAIVDTAGNIYITGRTTSPNFPLMNAIQTAYPKKKMDIMFITKLNPDGKMVYSTYLGRGGEVEDLTTFSVDGDGNLFLSGLTGYVNFPTQQPYQANLGNQSTADGQEEDIFITRMQPNGSLGFSTYLGGRGSEELLDLKFDGLGNMYLVGNTTAKNLPTSKAFQKKKGGNGDGFIAKFNLRGEVQYVTYFGGSGVDAIRDFAVDASGNLYITGKTGSTNLPTQNAFQATSGGFDDAFIAKFAPSGTLLFSSYYGGRDNEVPNLTPLKIGLDSAGNAYICGGTMSNNLPLSKPYQSSAGGTSDLFLAAFSATGSLNFATYLGGNADETLSRFTVDSVSGSAYIVGTTSSTNLQIINALQSSLAAPNSLFVSSFAPNGNAQFVTYLGGNVGEELNFFGLDNRGSLYLSGRTRSSNFPTKNAFQPNSGGGFGAFFDVYVTKFNSNGAVFSTFLGGSKDENDSSTGFFKIDASGNFYVYGVTSSSDLPVKDAVQSSLGGGTDAFLTKFDPQGNVLFSTFLGGQQSENITNMIVNNSGSIFLSGSTSSLNFPNIGGLQPTYGGGTSDGFFTIIQP